MFEEWEKERKRQVQLMLRGLQRRIDPVWNSAFCVLTPPPHQSKRVTTKNRFLKAFLVCYNVWSGFLTFRKHHAPCKFGNNTSNDITEDMNATAVRTWHFQQIWKTRISNVSSVVVSLTIQPLYPGWWHPLPINSWYLGRPHTVWAFRSGNF